MLRTLEPQKGAENKNAEADFKNPCSYKMKSVYLRRAQACKRGSGHPSVGNAMQWFDGPPGPIKHCYHRIAENFTTGSG